MTFTLRPMYPAGSVASASGFTLRPGRPILGGTTVIGAQWPDARIAMAHRLRRIGFGQTVQQAWQSQLRDGTTAVGVMGYQPYLFIGGGGGGGGSASYMLCDPSTVDWPNVTRTGRLPWFYGAQAGVGHFHPYPEVVGLATVYDPVAGFDTYGEAAVETWWPIITGSAVTVIKKPPYLWIGTDFSFLADTDVRKRQSESFRFSDAEPYGYCLRRYLGGDIDIEFGPDWLGAGWTMYAGKADPVTLVCDTFVPIASGAAFTSATVTAADMTGFGFAAWDQIFFCAFYTGSGIEPPEAIPFYGSPDDYVDLFPIAPTNIPPPYDMPGIDDWLPGGYLT